MLALCVPLFATHVVSEPSTVQGRPVVGAGNNSQQPNRNIENEAAIKDFYESFDKRECDKMLSHYADDVQLRDPVFPKLKGSEAKKMWRMLCKSPDLRVTVKDIVATDKTGSATWIADYTFSLTGKKVHNVIHANFEFLDGKIIRHRDQFDFWTWSKQAIPVAGHALGWSYGSQFLMQQLAAKQLKKFKE